MKRISMLCVLLAGVMSLMACGEQPLTTEALVAVEKKMTTSPLSGDTFKDNTSRFNDSECGLYGSRVEVNSGEGESFWVSYKSSQYPKHKQPVTSFFSAAGQCYLVTDTEEEAMRLNREHAAFLLVHATGAVRGVTLKNVVSDYTHVGNGPQAVEIRWDEGRTLFLVNHYIPRGSELVKQLQADFDVFVANRWKGAS